MRGNSIEQRLKTLAAFLNVKLEKRPSFWNDLMRQHLDVYGWLSTYQWTPGSDEWKMGTLEAVEELQWRVRTNLDHLLDPSADVGFELGLILDTIKSLKIRWECYVKPVNAQGLREELGIHEFRIDGNKVEEVKQPREVEDKTRLLKFGDRYWIVERGLFPIDLTQEIYGLIELALEGGYFSRLKKCRECARFFVADKNIDREFCPGKCTRRYFDKKEKSTPRVKASRERIRKNQIRRAERLIKQHKSFKDVKAETHLPTRILEEMFESV